MALPLSELDVLVLDCQATAAFPRGRLLEIGWARGGRTQTRPQSHLIRLPNGERIPAAVARITGISDTMMRDGVNGHAAWNALSAAAAGFAQQPAPTIIHFARFERPFLVSLAGRTPPLDVVCTHEIARRLLPDLPRCSLRAVTGYFGGAVGGLRRSAEHVQATAFIWSELVRLLEEHGVATWNGLHEWLDAAPAAPRRSRRVWPMPRDLRLSLPDAPGVYRLLRKSGDVLYVGKASSLHHRVNSYFRKQRRVPERLLEMLSQVRAVSFEATPSALEAALLEPDEIKHHRPPYNIALLDDRALWFSTPDLSERSSRPSPRCSVGPFPSAETLDEFAAFARVDRGALGTGRWAPDPAIFDEGYARLCAAHAEMSRDDVGAHAKLLRVGSRLWREGRRDCDPVVEDVTATLFATVRTIRHAAEHRRRASWTPEQVQFSLERLALRAALARRRAKWLTRMIEAAVVWVEPGASRARLIVIEDGEIADRASVEAGVTPPIPPGYQRPVAARLEALTLARFDRLRVLTTELKRLVSEGAPVAVRFGVAPALADARLAYALSWV